MRALAILLLLGACARSAPERPASMTASLPRDDARQALVGVWALRFAVDTINFRQPSTGATVAGTLTVRDTLVGEPGRIADLLRADFAADFASALGRPLSCFDSTARVLAATVHGDSVALSVTPYAADCGLSVTGLLRGDSIIGTWFEPSFAGGQSRGRVWMHRHTR